MLLVLGTILPLNKGKHSFMLCVEYFLKSHYLDSLTLPSFFISNGLLPCEFRRQYLSHAVLQAKNASNSDGLVGSAQGASDSGLLDLLEGKLAVLQFQIKIRDELEAIASNFESSVAMQDSDQNGPVLDGDSSDDSSLANAANEKAMELSSELKSVTQLYNEYAVPFELWEVSLKILNYHIYILVFQCSYGPCFLLTGSIHT